jgi:hypothetical protein
MLKKTIALIGLTLSVSANAAIVSIDDATFGADSVTRDTETGLEWLDITKSAGLSYDFVSANTGVGGYFDGWSYASVARVTELFTSAGGLESQLGANNALNFEPVQKLLGLWGTTYIDGSSPPPTEFGMAFACNTDCMQSTGAFATFRYEFNGSFPAVAIAEFNPGWDGAPALTNVGHALYRQTSAVPIPAAAWLFGSALLGLGALKRKTNSRSTPS